MPHPRSSCVARLVVALCCVTGGAFTATAHAAPSKEAAAEARGAYERGQRLFELRRYPEAIVEFEAGYKLSGDPVFLYNIAQSHRLGHQYTDAIHYYETYLKKVPTTERRGEIERRIVELKQAGQPPNQLDDGTPGDPHAPVTPPPAATTPAPPGPATLVFEPKAPPPPHVHDGFYFRALLGPGYLSVSGKENGVESTVHGAGVVGSVAFGGALSPRWIVYGTLFASSASKPKIKVGGVEGESDSAVTFSGVGVGASYYVMPLNLYASGALVACQTSFESVVGGRTERTETQFGPGLTLAVGKEWWAAREVGLGVAGVVHTGAMKMKDSDVTLGAFSIGLAFSLTYN